MGVKLGVDFKRPIEDSLDSIATSLERIAKCLENKNQ